ncbi:hypothetical protein ABK040_012746 [Willaertia magna]
MPKVKPVSSDSLLIKRIQKEMQIIINDPIPGCKAEPKNEKDLTEWNAYVQAPSDSVYSGGVFKLSIKFPVEYPFKPPQLKFLTKIYHCNISKKGNICLDLLKDRWNPSLTISKVLLSICSLLSEPNPSDPLEPKVAKVFLEERKRHDSTAKEWVERYALKGMSNEQESEDEDEE